LNTSAREKRIHWIDNLRSLTILLVVSYHVGGVYEAVGLWGSFWIIDDPATISWVGIVGIVFDIMVMPTMFFISGYLSPQSLINRSGAQYLKGKVKRLLFPWLIAVLTLIPLYKVIFLYSRNLPQEHWSTYFHFIKPNSQNWLWFLPVLFLFNILYLILIKSGVKAPRISIKAAILIILPIAFASSFFIGSALGFRSWTLTPLIDFENERLVLYFLTFLLGSFCHKKNAFLKKPEGKKLYYTVNATSWIPVTVHIIARIYPFFDPQGFEITPLYRLIWWASFYLSLLSMLYLMIETFRRYFNKTGKIWSWLSRNSFGVYILHVIMIGLFGTLLMKTNLPALAKYPLLIILTYLFSNLAVTGFRTVLKKLKEKNENY